MGVGIGMAPTAPELDAPDDSKNREDHLGERRLGFECTHALACTRMGAGTRLGSRVEVVWL